MRHVIVSNIVSLDGFYEAPGGDFTPLEMDAAFDASNLERLEAAGTVLLGRRSFEMFSEYWPGIADAPHDPEDPALDPVNRAISRRWNAVPKVVVSDTYEVPAGNAWIDDTTTVPVEGAAAWLSEERERGDGDIVVFGSRTMWNGLMARGLVDELHLMLSPAAFAGGTPVFDVPVALDLVAVRRWEGSRNVTVQYAVRR